MIDTTPPLTTATNVSGQTTWKKRDNMCSTKIMLPVAVWQINVMMMVNYVSLAFVVQNTLNWRQICQIVFIRSSLCLVDAA